MDSGNSSSVQSSSGGEEEYDSRVDSISAFLSPPSGLTSMSHHHSQLPTISPRRHHTPPSFFDPLSTYLDAFTRSPPLPPAPANSEPLLNLDVTWAGGLRTVAHPSCTDVGGLLGSALPLRDSHIATRIGIGGDVYSANINTSALPSTSSSPPQQQRPPSSAPPSDNPPNAAAAAAAAPPPRTSRKRSRASRRAPTTVLTTDTSNFRAMVQEFTGIPAPPFPSSSFPRSRFDLFHAASSSAMRGAGIPDTAPHSLLRPFAHKATGPPFGPFAPGPSSSSSSSAPPTIPATATATATATTSRANADGSVLRAFATNAIAVNASSTSIRTNTTSISNSNQLPPDMTALSEQHQNLLNMFNFQSLQSSPTTKYNSLGAAVLGGAKAHQESRVMPPARDSTVSGGALGVGRALAASEGMPSSRGGDDLLQWMEGSGGSEGGG